MLISGTPYGTTVGSDIQGKGRDMKKAQKLLKASGYDGTPIVIMKPTDLASIQKLPTWPPSCCARPASRWTYLQAMDWQTLVGRPTPRTAPDKGGWHMFLTAWQTFDVWSPIAEPDDGHPWREVGLVRLGVGRQDDRRPRNELMQAATDDGQKKKLAEQLHARAYEVATPRATGRVHAADGRTQEHQRLLGRRRQHLLEPGEGRGDPLVPGPRPTRPRAWSPTRC